MFDKSQIREHMDVTDASGQHMGTVDEVEGDRIKLTRSDSDDGEHHYISIEQVESVEDDVICLKEGSDISIGNEGY